MRDVARVQDEQIDRIEPRNPQRFSSSRDVDDHARTAASEQVGSHPALARPAT